jgi:hypothetical protein
MRWFLFVWLRLPWCSGEFIAPAFAPWARFKMQLLGAQGKKWLIGKIIGR